LSNTTNTKAAVAAVAPQMADLTATSYAPKTPRGSIALRTFARRPGVTVLIVLTLASVAVPSQFAPYSAQSTSAA